MALGTLAVLVWCGRRSSATFVALSLLTALAHPLGLAILVTGAVVGVVTGRRSTQALAPLLPAIAWALLQTFLGPWYGPTDDWLAMATVGFGVSVAPVMDIGKGASTWRALRGKPVTDKVSWGYFPAYLVVRRNAEITWMWSREHLYFLVRPSSRGELGFRQEENAWAREFHPNTDYAHKYRHVLVRTTHTEPDDNPAKNVFGENSARAVQLAHHGRCWLFEFMPDGQ